MFEKTKINEKVAGVGPLLTYKVINSLIQKAFSEMSQGPKVIVQACSEMLLPRCRY